MSIEAMKLALEELEGCYVTFYEDEDIAEAITALRQAIEQAQSKPDFERAWLVWQDKTEWVQETVQPHELGLHRADVLRQRIEQAQKQEPVRIMGFNCVCGRRMEVSAEQGVVPAPQRQPLTENEIKHLWYEACQTNLELTSQLIVHLARNIEAAHGIKGET